MPARARGADKDVGGREPDTLGRTCQPHAALEAALLALIAERPLSRITVSDVSKQADINRSTFYEHYDDLPTLAAEACARASSTNSSPPPR
ncbi:TetR family transcriptional regulator [Streptomyces sp. NPDC006516]|uniref:TetR family transcriptional regulator n=1 Tax=Streptomyces sp. NPDC006516 TaxID=3154309 RepID=UPI0033A14F5D